MDKEGRHKIVEALRKQSLYDTTDDNVYPSDDSLDRNLGGSMRYPHIDTAGYAYTDRPDLYLWALDNAGLMKRESSRTRRGANPKLKVIGMFPVGEKIRIFFEDINA